MGWDGPNETAVVLKWQCFAFVCVYRYGHGGFGSGGTDMWISSACFFVNCLCTSLFIITTKPLLRRYPPVSVTGWTYIVASLEMAAASMYYVKDGEQATAHAIVSSCLAANTMSMYVPFLFWWRKQPRHGNCH